VVSYLHLVMRAGLIDAGQEFNLVNELSSRYGVDIDTFSEGCDIARAEIDEAILDGTIGLL
jgi:hypothetical protein